MGGGGQAVPSNSAAERVSVSVAEGAVGADGKDSVQKCSLDGSCQSQQDGAERNDL